MGNPLQEETGDLLTLDTKVIAHPNAAELIGTHYEKTNINFQEFMNGLDSGQKSTFNELMKKSMMDFFDNNKHTVIQCKRH